MRKSGCPFTVRDYSIRIVNGVTEEEVPIKGLTEMSVDVESETGDARGGDSAWAEMFVKSRGVSGEITGCPIRDRVTGARDPGQALLHRAALSEGGCEDDRTLIVADAIGRAIRYDCVVTKESVSADEDGEEISWEWEGVGAPEELEYVQATAVAFSESGSVSVKAGETKELKVQFTPANASNQRYAYSIGDETVAALNAIDGLNLSIKGMRAGETTLAIKTMNNNLTANLTIQVTDGE